MNRAKDPKSRHGRRGSTMSNYSSGSDGSGGSAFSPPAGVATAETEASILKLRSAGGRTPGSSPEFPVGIASPTAAARAAGSLPPLALPSAAVSPPSAKEANQGGGSPRESLLVAPRSGGEASSSARGRKSWCARLSEWCCSSS